eukprot:1439840-Prymnesium_polylepis.1
MQLVSRVPRGSDAERAAQLEDHRIYTLFGTCHTNRCGPPTDKCDFAAADNELIIDKHQKAYAKEGKAVHAAEKRNKRAKLEHYGEFSAAPPVHAHIDEQLNELKGSVKTYREMNMGKKHVVRFFEIAAKCGDARPRTLPQLRSALARMLDDPAYDQVAVQAMHNDAIDFSEADFAESDDLTAEDLVEWWRGRQRTHSISEDAVAKVLDQLERHEEMQALTHEESVELESYRRSRLKHKESAEFQAERLLEESFLERKANDWPKRAEMRYQFLKEHLQVRAQMKAVVNEVDETTTLREVYGEFWIECGGQGSDQDR